MSTLIAVPPQPPAHNGLSEAEAVARRTARGARWLVYVAALRIAPLSQAESALALAHELEHRFGSSVRVITSLAGKYVDQDLIRERTDAEVVAKHPVVALVEAARDADLLVVGSRGLYGLKALGSVSERVAHGASCSVLVVRIAPPSQERSC